ncbi:MAG: DUF427 domain-containing protein [Alphaproteobacteria bacterium]
MTFRQLPSHDQILARVARYRSVRTQRPGRVDVPGVGQESVWDFPRPPAVEPVSQRLRVEWQGVTVADSGGGMRIIETAGAPVYYIPPADVRTDLLRETEHVTICEWKGAAVHYDLSQGQAVVRNAAFTYPDPLTDLGQGYEQVAGWYGFYPTKVDAVFVGEERARPQPGGYYAGWVTDALTGPIKGEPGSEGW